MKKNKLNTIIIIVIGALVLGGLFFVGRKGSKARENSINAIPGAAKPLKSGLIGNPMPAFSLSDRNGTEYSMDTLKGKKVVLFFNEGIMCYPGCWNQMVALATDPRFSAPDIAAFSVVIDRPSEWEGAIKKMPELAKAVVLFDSTKSISQSLGMLTVPSSMHYGAYPGHSFILIDKQGIVTDIFDDPNMGIDNDRVFEGLQKMN